MTLFGTSGIRGPISDTLDPARALTIARAIGSAAREDGERTFVLARDGRTTGPTIADAVSAGLSSAGVDVVRAGRLPTPALAYASKNRRGVMITASHNPPTDNGLKLFRDGVEYDREREHRVIDRVEAGTEPQPWSEWGTTSREDVLDSYRAAVTEYARRHGESITELSVALETGNGTASLATPHVLRALGADVVTINANVDGHFSGRESKPTPESLEEFGAFVRDSDVELGIAHDGDGDRIVVLDGTGIIVHEDTVLAILAAHFVDRTAVPDPVVLTTPNASGRIDERVSDVGGRTERTALGTLHDGMADLRRANADETEVVFAAEPWKHLHPGFGGWIDGVASAAVFARLLAAAGDFETLRTPIRERPYRKENLACPDQHKDAAMAEIRDMLPERFPDGTVDTRHGVRIDRQNGSWVLVRPSGTEPYVRIYAESDQVDELLETTVDVVTTAIERAQ